MKGKLDVSGDGIMNLSKGSRIDFKPPEGGGAHSVGGQGMQAKGMSASRRICLIDVRVALCRSRRYSAGSADENERET